MVISVVVFQITLSIYHLELPLPLPERVQCHLFILQNPYLMKKHRYFIWSFSLLVIYRKCIILEDMNKSRLKQCSKHMYWERWKKKKKLWLKNLKDNLHGKRMRKMKIGLGWSFLRTLCNGCSSIRLRLCPYRRSNVLIYPRLGKVADLLEPPVMDTTCTS